MNKLPNTYAYTKSLTEGLVAEFNGKLPIVIARPSIVTGALKEPFPGWVEGVNGPTGLLIGAGRGVVRSMHCISTDYCDVVPVDTTINSLIAIGWDRGLDESRSVKYVNITLSEDKFLTWGDTINQGREILHKYPLEYAVWYPGGSIKSSYFIHLLCVIFFHYMPAYILDSLMFICGKKPFLIRTQNKISDGLKVLQYYTTKPWIFNNERLIGLRDKLNSYDREVFDFDMRKINWNEYLKIYILGTREYLLKEKPESIPRARILARRLYILDKLVSLICYSILLYILWTYSGTIANGFDYVFQATKSLIVRD